MGSESLPQEELLGTFAYGDRVVTALLIVLIGLLIIWLGTRLIKRYCDILDGKTERLREEREASFPKPLTAADVKAETERLLFTERLLKMIELLVQRSVAFQFYKQLGKLPLRNFTAAMQETMIGEIANATFLAIELEQLAGRSILAEDYLRQYIIDTTIVTVDATLTGLIDNDEPISIQLEKLKGDNRDAR